MLDALGISRAAESVYLTMLASPQLDVAGLAAATGQPTPQVHQALDELLDLALVTAGVKMSALRPVAPAIGLAALIERAEVDMAERQRELASARAAVMSLAAAHQDARDREQVTNWIGVDAVRARLAELSAETTVECVSLNPRAAHTTEGKDASRPLNATMLERGVAIRCVYPDSHRFDQGLLDYANWLISAGGEIRTAPLIPLLLIVYDRRVAMLPIDPADSSRGAHEVHSPGMVATAYSLFQQIWTISSSPGTAEQQRDANLDPIAHQLLQLLAEGSTDETAARRLGVSPRTVKRKSAELMDTLNARSRFQAGAVAAQRGWITPSSEHLRRADLALAPALSRKDGAHD